MTDMMVQDGQKPMGKGHGWSRLVSRRGRIAGLALGLALALLLAPPAARADQDVDVMPATIGGHPVVEIAAGFGHSCARVDNGWAYCWGASFYGQLGDGTSILRNTPARVRDLTNVTQIVTGLDHSCALRSNGRVLCWGRNNFGQLGDRTTTDRLAPVRVQGLSGVVQIAAGRNHTCAVRSNGRVFCWGSNSNGQLGDGTTTDSPAIVRVEGPATTSAVQVSAGFRHSCLLRAGGRITCWGDNASGQLGIGNTIPQAGPVVVSQLSSVLQIASGMNHNCALRGNRRVFCWGSNTWGQIGDGTRNNNRTTPVRLDSLRRVRQVSLGFFHSCAYRNTGIAFCWGQNDQGQLGDGTTDLRTLPTRTAGTRMIDTVDLGAGGNHTCGVRANGRAFCWGRNFNGQLGNGTNTASLVAVRVQN